MTIFNNINELMPLIGTEIGHSPSVKITQAMIEKFADATFDHQWIHVDPAKAATDSPYKTTIAHGYFTLSLAPHLVSQTYKIASAAMSINYGADKIRFTAPVPVESELFLKVVLKDIREFESGYRLLTTCTFHIKSSAKPVCIADLVTLVYED